MDHFLLTARGSTAYAETTEDLKHVARKFQLLQQLDEELVSVVLNFRVQKPLIQHAYQPMEDMFRGIFLKMKLGHFDSNVWQQR